MGRTSVLNAEDLSALPREAKVAVLRARMQSVVPSSDGLPDISQDLLHTIPELDKLLPFGGLLRRTINHLSESPSLVSHLIATVTRAGKYVAVVGWPDFSYAEVFDSGGDLSRVIVVPNPGADALNITAALVEGMDLVIYRHPVPEGSGTSERLSPTAARPLHAKVRRGTAALLCINLLVPNPTASISATTITYRGVGAGSGRITGIDLRIDVATRQGKRRGTLTLGRPAQLHAL